VRGVSSALADTERNLVLLTARDRREQEKVGRYVMQGHVDGVVFMSLHREDVLPGILERSGVPVVLAGRPLDGRPASYVDADNVGGAREAVAHLLSGGRRAIAAITGPLDMYVAQCRLRGYRQALADAGLPTDPSWTVEGDFTEASGRRAMTELLERHPDVDAVLAASDTMAAGALTALRAAGRRVPDDVAVVGFDDFQLAQHTDPPLTTVRQPLEEIGRTMVRLLLEQMEDSAVAWRHVILRTELVLRDSA